MNRRLSSSSAALGTLSFLILGVLPGGPGAAGQAPPPPDPGWPRTFTKEGTTQLKDIRIEQVQYGPDGQLQRIQLNDDPSNHPRRFLRKLIAQAEKQQIEQYLQGLRGLLEQYTLPTAGKVIAFMSGATVESVQAPDGSELLKMQGSGVVVPGDTLAIWVDASTHEMRKAQISTTFEGGSASVEATYKTNGAGLTHVSMAEVDAPAKNLTLQIHNYDYEPND